MSAPFALTSEAAPAEERRPFFDALAAAARKKLGAAPEWQWCCAEALRPTDDILLEGGIPNAGRKGRAEWKGVALQRCVVTRDEVDAARREYEAATGKCSECAGSGRRNVGWSREAGRLYRDCERCGATGAATEPRP